MARYFSDKDLERLRREYLEVSAKHDRLMQAYVWRVYKDARAREFATHGFARRLKTLVRCIDNVFQILPPERTDIPPLEQITDATIHIQAFVFNVFGIADNLAWIWVRERALLKKNGKAIPDNGIGLRKKIVRDSFSPAFQEYLDGLNPWFEMQENFRHALAHRIPLYVPPYMVPTSRVTAYNDLAQRMNTAIMKRDVAEYDRLSAEQDALGIFRPEMTHSIEEKPGSIVFHVQMLVDFKTIEDLAYKFLAELNR